MDFNFKKLVGEAGSVISRAVQMTEEALYSGEKTTLDPQLERLMKHGDAARNWTQRIVKDLDSVLVPNPGYRVEDYLMEKIENKKRQPRMSNMECLGQGMIEAGNEFGAGTAYGSILIKVGQNELKLGQEEREFISTALNAYSDPLNRFLENEVKNVTRERKVLENKRLDLDAAKNRLRKGRTLSTMPAKDGTDPRALVQQAERDVVTAEQEFKQQCELVKSVLEIMLAARDRHVENLKQMVAAQTTYYERCHQLVLILSRDLETMPLSSVSLQPSVSVDDHDQNSTFEDDGMISAGVPAKVMYDYEAKTAEEISLKANERVRVADSPDMDYYIAMKADRHGKIPKSCIMLL